MPKPILPDAPVHGYKLTFWTLGLMDEVVERTWVFYLEPTSCAKVTGDESLDWGVAYVNQWYTGGGRFDGWALPSLATFSGSGWDNCFPTRLEALRCHQKMLKTRCTMAQDALMAARAKLTAVEKELASIPNKRDLRAMKRLQAGISKPEDLPPHRLAKLKTLSQEKP